MSLGAQSTGIMILNLVLYVLAPLILLIKRGPLRTGFAMLAVTLLPLLWQASASFRRIPNEVAYDSRAHVGV